MLTSSAKFTGEQRRRVPYRSQAGACSLKVELVPDNPEGMLEEGLIRVPERLCNAKPDTNEKHEFDRLINDNLNRWTDWRKARGYECVSKPIVRGPFDPPSPTTSEDPLEDGVKWYFAIARFRRSEPLWRPLDEVLYLQDMADLYDVKPTSDPKPWNEIKSNEDTGWMDPLKHAEERRKKLGLKRADYLFSPLDQTR